MRRREFIGLLGATSIGGLLPADAQQVGRTHRIGALMGIANDVDGQARVAAF